MRTQEDFKDILYSDAIKITDDIIAFDIVPPKDKEDDLGRFLYDLTNKFVQIAREQKQEYIPMPLAGFQQRHVANIGNLLQPWVLKNKNCITISMQYKGKPFTEFNFELDHCQTNEQYQQVIDSVNTVIFRRMMSDNFFNPKLRTLCVTDKGYTSWVQSYFQSIAENTGKIQMQIIKENFPDFYQFLTEKLEIPKLEEFDQWMANKKELSAIQPEQ